MGSLEGRMGSIPLVSVIVRYNCCDIAHYQSHEGEIVTSALWPDSSSNQIPIRIHVYDKEDTDERVENNISSRLRVLLSNHFTCLRSVFFSSASPSPVAFLPFSPTQLRLVYLLMRSRRSGFRLGGLGRRRW
jgi:hypothetical protein